MEAAGLRVLVEAAGLLRSNFIRLWVHLAHETSKKQRCPKISRAVSPAMLVPFITIDNALERLRFYEQPQVLLVNFERIGILVLGVVRTVWRN